MRIQSLTVYTLLIYSSVTLAISHEKKSILGACFGYLKSFVYPVKEEAILYPHIEKSNPESNWLTAELDPRVPISERKEIIIDESNWHSFPKTDKNRLAKKVKDAEALCESWEVENISYPIPNQLNFNSHYIAAMSEYLAAQKIRHKIVYKDLENKTKPVIIISTNNSGLLGEAARKVVKSLPEAVLTIDPGETFYYSRPKEMLPPYFWEHYDGGPWHHRVNINHFENPNQLWIALEHEIGHGKTVSDLQKGVPGYNYGVISRSRGSGYDRFTSNDEQHQTIRTLLRHVDTVLKKQNAPDKLFARSFTGALEKLADSFSSLGGSKPQKRQPKDTVQITDVPIEIMQLMLNLEQVAVSYANAYAPVAKGQVSVGKPIVQGNITWHEMSFFNSKSGRTNVFIPIHSSWGFDTPEKQLNYIQNSAKQIVEESKKIHSWLNLTQEVVNKLPVSRNEKLRAFLKSLKQLEYISEIPNDPAEQENLMRRVMQ